VVDKIANCKMHEKPFHAVNQIPSQTASVCLTQLLAHLLKDQANDSSQRKLIELKCGYGKIVSNFVIFIYSRLKEM
jgi:hypothetical protein